MSVIALDIQPPLRQGENQSQLNGTDKSNVIMLNPECSLTNDQLAALIEAIASEKNRDAFARLFEHYAPRLKAFGMKQGVTPAKVEELVQETMLMVWRKSESFDSDRGTANNWIFTIMRNKRIDMFRRQKHPEYELDESMDIVDTDATPDDQVNMFQESEMIREAVSSLPEAQIEIIQKAFFEDKSHGEIAEDLGIPLGTVKSRIRLAVARLRILVEETV
jgi:RNA polymerase sigma-70 factor (ECF subfamily)